MRRTHPPLQVVQHVQHVQHVQVVQLVLLVLILSIPSVARAWGTKEHLQLTRIAAERLIADDSTPPEMKQWLRIATPGLMDMDGEKKWFMEEPHRDHPRDADGIVFWAVMPDVTIAMEGREEKKVCGPSACPSRSSISPTWSFSSPATRSANTITISPANPSRKISRDMKDHRYVQAGMLPFRVEDCYKKLVDQLRAGRLTDASPASTRDEHAGNGRGTWHTILRTTRSPSTRRSTTRVHVFRGKGRKAPNVHAQVEYIMADDDNDDHMASARSIGRSWSKPWTRVEDPIKTDDLCRRRWKSR